MHKKMAIFDSSDAIENDDFQRRKQRLQGSIFLEGMLSNSIVERPTKKKRAQMLRFHMFQHKNYNEDV